MIDKGQWREFGQDTRVTPLLFTRSAMGFLVTTESQDLGLTSHPKDGAFWRYSVPVHYTGALRPTQTTGWAPPAGLTNTSSNSNLVFPGGLPSRDWPGSTLLSFSGQPVLGCRVIWLWKSPDHDHPYSINSGYLLFFETTILWRLLTLVQKTIIDTLHKEGKSQRVITERGGCSEFCIKAY